MTDLPIGQNEPTPPAGRRERPEGIPRRIASLLPAATEFVCALGLGDRLVLRSHECDVPPWVEALPFGTRPKYEPDGTSYQIDERVRALVQEGLSVYRVNAMALRRAAPQVIVTQEHCEVCAVPAEAVHRAVAELLDPAPMVVSLSPSNLREILSDTRRLAEALGVPDRGEALALQLAGQMRALASRVHEEARWRPRVVTVEWLDPLMVGGNWVPELVRMAGGEDLLGVPGEHSPFVTWDRIREADPDVIVVIPCGFGIERSRQEMEILTSRPGWEAMAAVREGRVALADGHHYFNRPGPRIVESLRILVEILHPEMGSGLEEKGQEAAAPRWVWL